MKKSILLGLALYVSVLLSAVSHSVSFSTADLEFTQESSGYDVLRMQDCLVTENRGEPELPVKFINLIIPSGMEVDNINISQQYQFLEESYFINPSPGSLIIGEDFLPAEPNPDIYNSTSIFPSECVEVISHGYFDGGNRIVTLAIYPVQYIPKDGIIQFNSNINFTLTFKSSDQPTTLSHYRLAKYDAMYDKILRSMVENDGDVDMYKYQPTILSETREGDVEMYIIGEAEFAADFADFIEWKRMKGLSIEYRDIASIQATYPFGDNWNGHNIADMAGSIRAFLRDVYSDSLTVYALILGGSTDFDSTPSIDDDELPIRYSCWSNDSWLKLIDHDNNPQTPPVPPGWAPNNNFWRIPTDLYFQDFDGNYDLEGDTDNYYGERGGYHPDTQIYYPADPIDKYPEVFTGRLILSDQEDLDNHEQIRRWIDKLITYETNPGYGDFDYLDRTVLFDGFWFNDDQSPWYGNTIYGNNLDNILNGNFSYYEEVEPNHSVMFPTGTYVLDEMNDDVGFSHFYWHGSKYLVDNHSIPNTGGHPVCALDYYDDYWLAEPTNGFDNLIENGKYSFCFMISCNPGSYDKSQGASTDYWGNRISMAETFSTYLDQQGGPTIVANTNSGYGYISGNGGISEDIELYFLNNLFYNQCYNAGIALSEAKTHVVHTSESGHCVQLCTTLFGDPEMEVWTDIPEYLEVQHNYWTNSVTVTCNGIPVENVDVYFSTANCSEDDFVQTDVNGVAQCNFVYQEICVNKHDYIPYIKRIVRGSETWANVTNQKWDIIIPSGSTLNVNCDLNLLSFGGKNAQIIVEEGGTLNVNANAVINGYTKTFVPDESSDIQVVIPGNKIEVYGNLTVNNATFSSIDDNYWDGVFIYDCTNILMINPTFENCNLTSEDSEVTISDGAFTNSWIKQYREDIEVDGVAFTNSFFYANGISDSPLQQSQKTTIENCCFDNSVTGTAIYITTYSDFEIVNNPSISTNGTSISIHESGSGRTHLISNNFISGNSTGYGILLYHSYAEITGYNNIYDKYAGIVGLNNSEITLVGDDEGGPFQTIRNNIGDEVVFSHDSFPSVFHYNRIYDNTHEYDFVKCNGHEGGSLPHNVTQNYWGTIFDPLLDFYPVGAFEYEPQWNPIPGDPDEAELLYTQAQQYEEEENYDLARSTYQSVIENYPESEFAAASAKQLLALEKKIGESRSIQDFAALKMYYETEPNMSYNTDMQNLASDLSNYCDIEMANYETAIGYSESIIANPPSLQDSVFAVIDAGYTYLLMETSSRSNFVGQIASLKPNSREEFDQNREQLIDELLGGNYENPENIVPSHVILNNNYPNPFNPTTTISFSIPNENKVDLAIFNIKGQKVKTLISTELDKGSHSVIWNGVDDSGKIVSSGVYFYKLSVDGKSKAVKKCLMLK
jgi:hypothetical protein